MAPELPDPAFAKVVVLTPDAHAREVLKHRLRVAISEGLVPEASVRVTQLVFGPYTPFRFEFRIMGPDQEELYKIPRLLRLPILRSGARFWHSRLCAGGTHLCAVTIFGRRY